MFGGRDLVLVLGEGVERTDRSGIHQAAQSGGCGEVRLGAEVGRILRECGFMLQHLFVHL